MCGLLALADSRDATQTRLEQLAQNGRALHAAPAGLRVPAEPPGDTGPGCSDRDVSGGTDRVAMAPPRGPRTPPVGSAVIADPPFQRSAHSWPASLSCPWRPVNTGVRIPEMQRQCGPDALLVQSRLRRFPAITATVGGSGRLAVWRIGRLVGGVRGLLVAGG